MDQPDRHRLPFLWGAATSSHQIEGYNDNNDWTHWENQGHIKNGEVSGPATDHLNRFREDIGLAAELGLTSYRFSIEWSRLEPEDGKWDLDSFNWYLDLIGECERHHLLPMLTLHHFTSPKWFADKGGFTWDEAPERFARMVRQVAKILGPRIPLWCTINEPNVLVIGSYLGQFMPPGKFAPDQAAIACHHLLKAHVFAYDILHSEILNRKGPWMSQRIQVGIAHNMLDFVPYRLWHPCDQMICYFLRKFYNQAWLDAVTGRKQRFGIIGFLPTAPAVKSALGRRTIDFIGINYYTKMYVKWIRKITAHQSKPNSFTPVILNFSKENKNISDTGWEIHPRGLNKMLQFVKQYRLPIYITENGIADKSDTMRSDFLLSHLKIIARAIQNGINICGYYHWSLLDNYEWINGFEPRFGLYKVDYTTFNRTPTNTALLYKRIIKDFRSWESF